MPPCGTTILLLTCLVCLLRLLSVAAASSSVETLPCVYTRGDALLLLECGQQSQLRAAVESGDIHSDLLIERNLDQLSVPNTELMLSNATVVRPQEARDAPNVPVEIKRCGLTDLGRLLASDSGSQGSLLLNFSSLSLRLGGHGDFDGLSPATPTWLDLSHNLVDFLPPGVFDALPNLVALDLSWNRIEHLENDTFCSAAGTLLWLDLRGNPMMATYALPPLRALQWLDASLSVLHVGTFCRMYNLTRVSLHRPVTILRCFVFDTLPNLSELSLAYYTGARNVCLTMMCSPHPVLNGTSVRFNYSIASVYENGTVSSQRRNLKISNILLWPASLYQKLCVANYINYLAYHARGLPATEGCTTLESSAPTCRPRTAPPSSLACSPIRKSPIRPDLLERGLPVAQSSAATARSSTRSTRPESDEAEVNFSSSLTGTEAARTASSTALAAATTAPKTLKSTVPDSDYATALQPSRPTSDSPTNGIREAILRHRKRSEEVEKQIAQLEQGIYIVYAIIGLLLLILLGMACWYIADRCRRRSRRRRRNHFWRQPPGGGGQELPGAEQHPLQLTRAAAASTADPAAPPPGAAAATANGDDALKSLVGADPDNEYVPMNNADYSRLPGVFPNPIYGRASKA